MKNPSRRDLITGVAASATLTGAAGRADAFRLVGAAGGLSTVPGTSFVSSVTPGTPRNNYGLGAGYKLGMQVLISGQPITLSAVGRLVAPGNSQTHQIVILRSSDLAIIPGGAATVNTAGTPAGQFAFAALPGPVVLQAGNTYYFLSSEQDGGDLAYDTNTIVTTTSDASILSATYQLSAGYLANYSSANQPHPLNFQYSVGVPGGMPALLLGGLPASDYFGTQLQYTPTSGVLTGTTSLQVTWLQAIVGSTVFVYQWMLDGVPISSILTADTSAAPNYNLAFSFDTTTVADGVHYVYPQFLECNNYSVPAIRNIYFERVTIANHGSPNTTPGQVVAASCNKSHFIRSIRPDFITYDGTPNPVHTTYPVPYNFIPSGAGDASLRDASKWYAEVQPGPRTTEYDGVPQWTLGTSGDVYISVLDPLSYSSTPGAYGAVVNMNPEMGTRLNAYISPYTTYAEDPTTSGQWYGVAINGLLFKIDRQGNTTPIVGWVRNRSLLTIDPYSNPSEATIDLYRTLLGTFDFAGDIGGANDLCFDPRDSNIVYVTSQVDHFIAKVNLTTLHVSLYAGAPSDTGGYVDGAAATAQFNQPASIIMASSGIMFVADQQNSAIRMISADGTTVSTLCGGSVGPTPPTIAEVNAVQGAYPVTSITWDSMSNSGTVVMATPIPNIELGWALRLTGGINSLGQNPNFTYVITALTDGSHFTVQPEARTNVPTIGTLSGSMVFTVYTMDYYSRPGTVTFTGGQGWVCFPNTVRLTSSGNIVFVEAATFAVRLIDLGAHTIRRVGCPDDHIQFSGLGWVWLDVDIAGTCGPVDDIIVRPFETEFNAAHWDWRLSLAPGSIVGQAAYSAMFMHDSPSPGLPTYGPVATITAGPGHYPWAIALSRVEGRMITTGMANWQPSMLRIKQSSDPIVDSGTRQNWDTAAFYRGFDIMRFGTAKGLPIEARPSFLSLWGENGSPMIGNRGSGINTFEDMMALLPTDTALGTFIQAGMGGGVARPELTGNDLRDLIYFIRRGTLQGSLGPTPIAPAPDDPDVAPPIILTISATRVNSSTLRVDWTTNKPTIGVAAAASLAQYPFANSYCMFSAIESNYGTTHSMNVTVPPAATTLHYTAVAKDIAGNCVHSADALIT